MKEKILIIEDEEDLVKGLRLNLADEGYEVDWASDGVEGLRKALEERPQLIILDIMLPKMNGLDIYLERSKVQCLVLSLDFKVCKINLDIAEAINFWDCFSLPLLAP
ncbi:Regulator of RpoS [subsurface metagenome]